MRLFQARQPGLHLELSVAAHLARETKLKRTISSRIENGQGSQPYLGEEDTKRRRSGCKRVTWSRQLLRVRSISPRQPPSPSAIPSSWTGSPFHPASFSAKTWGQRTKPDKSEPHGFISTSVEDPSQHTCSTCSHHSTCTKTSTCKTPSTDYRSKWRSIPVLVLRPEDMETSI